MIPHEKEMVESLKDKPFALLGINSDGDRSVVNKILKEHGVKGLPVQPAEYCQASGMFRVGQQFTSLTQKA